MRIHFLSIYETLNFISQMFSTAIRLGTVDRHILTLWLIMYYYYYYY